MTTTTGDLTTGAQAELTGNLARYYLVRAIIAAAWVAAAVGTGGSNGTAAALLLIVYPAWDALANWFDTYGNGGLRANPAQALTLLVGPEGGFSPEEEDAAMAAGALPLTMGPRVLRTETAALAAMAMLAGIWGGM